MFPELPATQSGKWQKGRRFPNELTEALRRIFANELANSVSNGQKILLSAIRPHMQERERMFPTFRLTTQNVRDKHWTIAVQEMSQRGITLKKDGGPVKGKKYIHDLKVFSHIYLNFCRNILRSLGSMEHSEEEGFKKEELVLLSLFINVA